ncbi:MAG: 16S rRNA (cytidine(1402)-2'-O)-methyltransferase [Patescibacteria group bacterium]
MGTLYVVATPIGNLEDITLRALRILFTVSYIACEDTRRTGMLLAECKKRYKCTGSPTLISYYDQVEQSKTPEILELLNDFDVALVSDAGTPLISDPGYVLVREARKRNISVIAIPGPNAAITALSVSGLAVSSFMFFGYPPEKQSTRLTHFKQVYQCINTLVHKPTVIYYCAPHNLNVVLTDMKEVFGDIQVTIARELTKIHEEVWSGTIDDAKEKFVEPKGEFVLLF